MITKNILLLIGAFAILSAGVVGVNAYLSKKATSVIENPEEELLEESTSTEPEVISPTSEIDISDWETYRNEEYGFEIEYPKNSFSISNDNTASIWFYDKKEWDLYLNHPEQLGYVPSAKIFIAYPQSAEEDFIDWIKKDLVQGRGEDVPGMPTIEEIIEKGEKVRIGHNTWMRFYDIGPGGESYIYYTKKNKRIITVTIFRDPDEIFYQMLSTFKFDELKF